MKAHEIKAIEERLKLFRKMEARRNQINAALERFSHDDPNGPCGQSPFTGNTRETRRIVSLGFHFTPTLGGAQEVHLHVGDLYLPAGELGDAIVKMLVAERKIIVEEMEKL